MAFSTMGSEEKKANKKKKITGYKCGKSGNYSHKCDEVETVKTSNTNIANKKGSNFLVLKEDTVAQKLRPYLQTMKKKN